MATKVKKPPKAETTEKATADAGPPPQKEEKIPEGFDLRWLDGLEFWTSKALEKRPEDGNAIRYAPVSRPLRVSDVMAWREDGEDVILVTTDGRKHRVGKE